MTTEWRENHKETCITCVAKNKTEQFLETFCPSEDGDIEGLEHLQSYYQTLLAAVGVENAPTIFTATGGKVGFMWGALPPYGDQYIYINMETCEAEYRFCNLRDEGNDIGVWGKEHLKFKFEKNFYDGYFFVGDERFNVAARLIVNQRKKIRKEKETEEEQPLSKEAEDLLGVDLSQIKPAKVLKPEDDDGTLIYDFKTKQITYEPNEKEKNQ